MGRSNAEQCCSDSRGDAGKIQSVPEKVYVPAKQGKVLFPQKSIRLVCSGCPGFVEGCPRQNRAKTLLYKRSTYSDRIATRSPVCSNLASRMLLIRSLGCDLSRPAQHPWTCKLQGKAPETARTSGTVLQKFQEAVWTFAISTNSSVQRLAALRVCGLGDLGNLDFKIIGFRLRVWGFRGF